MICFSLLYALASTTYNTASSTIYFQTTSNSQTDANEIAEAISQQLAIVGESVSMVGALYSQALMNTSTAPASSVLAPILSFREYDFVAGAKYPKVPHDFGALAKRSRFPMLPGFINGSLSSSSVYLLQKVNGFGFSSHSDVAWNTSLNNTPAITQVINNLAYQDRDLSAQYIHGPNTTIMFYVSAAIGSDIDTYTSIHRTFPGIIKANNTYDPPSRGKFKF